ncbi:hypothetical protein L486_07593 [Kwoniella mangroviensis CBS 10435]|uniref:Poly(A) RNA polymerase mitochondrial-like central palm domain-containing protein n=1 Tax=Kwoniella mangroviensis CBS 10435 TaxID=1331196 RepID=A0A1B9IHL6_9TREE|nr:hypothetical protein L486_07593 [Kwoniella mangroviensis CBS 10435]
MPPSLYIHPTFLPSPQLITFDEYNNQPSLLDLDEYDPPPPPEVNIPSSPTFTITPTETLYVGGGKPRDINLESLNPEARAFYPSTPQPILLSSQGNQEELDRLFSLYTNSSSPSPSPSPSLSPSPVPTPTGTATKTKQRRNSSSSTLSPRDRTNRRRRRSKSSVTSSVKSISPTVSPRRKATTRAQKGQPLVELDHIGSYPPSPILGTPDLTSRSTASSFHLPNRPNSASSPFDQPILISDPSELVGLFAYSGTAYPFPQEVTAPVEPGGGGLKTSAATKVQEELIQLEDHQDSFNPLHKSTEEQEDSAFIDLLGLSPSAPETNLLEEVEFENSEYEREEETYTPYSTIDYKYGLDTDELIDIDELTEETMNHDSQYGGPNGSSTCQVPNGDISNLEASSPNFPSSSSLNHLSSSSSVPRVHNVSPYNLLLSEPSPLHTVPSNLAHPKQLDVLQTEIMQAWISTEPTQESKVFVRNLLSTLTSTINKRFGTKDNQRFLVDVFGSVSWGGETGQSGDLDLVILDRAQLRGYEPSLWRQSSDDTSSNRVPSSGRRSVPPAIRELPRCYYTYDLANCLRDSGMREVQPIPGASTPIVKFKDPTGKMECDINVNDLGGWYNSSLILHYCLISPYLLRPMIYILKRWLSAQDLNDASGAKGPATMSSYCLTLMIIGYLQNRGCLPNLQRDINVPPVTSASDTSDPDVIWVSWSKQQGVPAHKSAEPDLTVSDAVKGFFTFFSHTSPLFSADAQDKARFDHTKEIISILQGGVASRVTSVGGGRVEDQLQRNQLAQQGFTPGQIDSVMEMMRESRIKGEEKMGKGDRGIQPRNWSERRLVVQDPFLWQKNCAGMMSKAGLDRFFTCVDRAHDMLQAQGKSATIERLLFNPSPMIYKTPTSGRGRGFRGSPISMRGRPGGRGLWNP